MAARAPPAKPWERATTASSSSPAPLNARVTSTSTSRSTRTREVAPARTLSIPSQTSAPPVASSSAALQGNVSGTISSAHNTLTRGAPLPSAGNGTIDSYGSSYQNRYGDGYNSGMYGSSSYGSGYGSGYNSGYSNPGYGYNNYGGYGGGYSGMYGGGGYGMSGYGGYGMGNRMGGAFGPMGPEAMGGPLGWLASANTIVGSVGQITELLGMNTDALNFCLRSLMGFLDRIGHLCEGVVIWLSPRQEFPPGHPRHGEPPPSPEEERARLRRVRFARFLISMVVIYLARKVWRMIVRNISRRLFGGRSRAAISGNHNMGNIYYSQPSLLPGTSNSEFGAAGDIFR